MIYRVITGIAAALILGSAASAQTFTGSATCKLTNTAVNASLYEGPCTVQQSEGYGGSTVFAVQMGNTQPFMFAGNRGQDDWQHGPDKVQFIDLPNGGIFHWSTYALVVAE